MNPETLITAADLQKAFEELVPILGSMIFSVGSSGALLGLMLGWSLRGRYERRQWCKQCQSIADGEL